MNITRYLPSGSRLDPVQLSVIIKLENIACNFESRSFFDYFRANSYKKNGVYLYGGVGRGKTMLMQAFYHRLSLKKQLVHYQEFMQLAHQNIHKLQGKSTEKILNKLAKDYAHSLQVLCLDEFEIKDITDAMIIGKLFKELIKHKLFICVTSNTKPDNLYQDGLQRESFLPFIKMLNQEFEVLQLEGSHDYRLDKLSKLHNRILYPLSSEIKVKMKQIILELTDNKATVPSSIEVFGRQIFFKRTYGAVLISNFKELFMEELGYIDYVNICQKFPIIIIEDVPVINADHTDLITRFINFVDNAYFHKVLLFITLQDAPEKIYQEGKRSEEFQRTVSRLHEMNSDLYLETIYD